MEQIEVKIVEAEVSALNILDGDTLVIKVRGEGLNPNSLNMLKKQFERLLPDNKVIVIYLRDDHQIEIEKITT